MKLRLALACAAVLAAVQLFAANAPRPPLLANGTPAPDFTVYDPSGKPVKLSDYKGKVVLIDFWATWCGPCKITMPHMEKLHRALGPQGLVVLGVCVWDTQQKFDGWLKAPEVPTTYPKVFDRSPRNADIANKLYRVSGIPTFYVVDREGKIMHSGVGADPRTAAALNQALERAGLKL